MLSPIDFACAKRHMVRRFCLIVILVAAAAFGPLLSAGERAEIQLLPHIVHYDSPGIPPKSPPYVSISVQVTNPSAENMEFDAIRTDSVTHTGAIPFRIQLKRNGEWSRMPADAWGYCSLESVERLGPNFINADFYHTEKYGLAPESSTSIEVFLASLPEDWEAIRLRFFWEPTVAVPRTQVRIGCPGVRPVRETDEITSEEEALFGNVVTREDVEAPRKREGAAEAEGDPENAEPPEQGSDDNNASDSDVTDEVSQWLSSFSVPAIDDVERDPSPLFQSDPDARSIKDRWRDVLYAVEEGMAEEFDDFELVRERVGDLRRPSPHDIHHCNYRIGNYSLAIDFCFFETPQRAGEFLRTRKVSSDLGFTVLRELGDEAYQYGTSRTLLMCYSNLYVDISADLPDLNLRAARVISDELEKIAEDAVIPTDAGEESGSKDNDVSGTTIMNRVPLISQNRR